MMKAILPVTLVAALMLSGCAGMSDTQQRTLSGAGIGAAGGAVIGAIAGNAGLGAVIGTGVGAAGGYVYDQHKKAQKRSYDDGYKAGQASK
jgi:osmotically inducible lipoprotein OsmB